MSAFEEVVDAVCADPAVERGQMFGHPGAKLAGKFFVMEFQDDIVVKLGVERVAELVDAGGAQPFDPSGRGRPMKDWAQVGPVESGNAAAWTELAEEAKLFVADG